MEPRFFSNPFGEDDDRVIIAMHLKKSAYGGKYHTSLRVRSAEDAKAVAAEARARGATAKIVQSKGRLSGSPHYTVLVGGA